MELKPQEIELIKTIREIGFGTLTIKIQNGVPTHGEEPLKNIDFSKKARQHGLIE